WIFPIAKGLKIAKAKSRSPHWMWFGIHPLGGWIALIVLRRATPGDPRTKAQRLADDQLKEEQANREKERRDAELAEMRQRSLIERNRNCAAGKHFLFRGELHRSHCVNCGTYYSVICKH